VVSSILAVDVEIENKVFKMADRCGIVNVYSALRRWLTKSQIAILMYHRVCRSVSDFFLQSLTPEDFEKQISYISKNFRALSLSDLVKSLCSLAPPPRKAIVITFDDGYKDNYTYAYPILSKYCVPATIFLTTGYIGTGKLFWWDIIGYVAQHTSAKQFTLDGIGKCSFKTESERADTRFRITEKLRVSPEHEKSVAIQKLLDVAEIDISPDLGKDLILSWSEIKEMEEGGITFGAHTVNHPVLTGIPLEIAREEIIQSKVDIERNLHKEVTSFSYPNGLFNEEIVDIVRNAGFTCATAVSPCRLVSSKDDIYRLNRIICNVDFNRFKAMISGLLGDLETCMRSKPLS